MQVQGSHTLPIGLVGQHPWASGRLSLAEGVGYEPGEHLPLSELPIEHRLRKPEPPNTSTEIKTSQPNYYCQEVATKPLRVQRFGNLRAKAGDARSIPRSLCILSSK